MRLFVKKFRVKKFARAVVLLALLVLGVFFSVRFAIQEIRNAGLPWWQKESTLVKILQDPQYQTPVQNADTFLLSSAGKDFLAKAKAAPPEKINGKQSTVILQKDFYKGLKIVTAFGDLEFIPFANKENQQLIEGTVYKNSVAYATKDKLVAYLYNKEENELKEFVAIRQFDSSKLYSVGDQGKKEGLAYQWQMTNSADYRMAYEQGALAFYGPAPQYAREPEAPKNLLYFKIPAPVIIHNSKFITQDSASAFWEVSGDVLFLKVQFDDAAIKKYANRLLMIDPSIEIGAKKVKDPEKQVQDEHTKKLLQEKNIDPDYVELAQDYAKRLTPEEKAKKENDNSRKGDPDPSPYSRTYRDNQTGKYVAEVQGLPMVDTQGNKIEASWERKGSKYMAKNNLFDSTIKNNNVEITVKSDQPDGREQGDKLKFAPQVFLNGKEQKVSKPKLLAVDPINPNYKNNTLEWDYGVAKRRLRLIEGSALGSWIFSDNPGGDVRIVYNQKGGYRLALGQYKINDDEEFIPASVLASAKYPLNVSYASAFQYGRTASHIAQEPKTLAQEISGQFNSFASMAKPLLSFNASKKLQRPYATAEAQAKFHEELAKNPVGTKKIISPYQEVTNLGNGQFSAEISGLPLTKADLTPINPVWRKQGNTWVAGENLFASEVKGNKVRVEAGNDQPLDDVKQGDDVTFAPQLLVGGKEYKAKTGPVALAVDPMNENYQNNTLEWDYGVAKRRLRIIEGNIQGSWVFYSNPMAEVRIKYNQKGRLTLNLGGSSSVVEGTPLKVAVVNNDEEVVPAEQFTKAKSYPVSIADSYTFYPDASPETTTVDGWVEHAQTGLSWATLVAAAGNGASDADNSSPHIKIDSWNVANQWVRIIRSIYLFDTSGLPDSATVTSATLSLYGSAKYDGLSGDLNINIYTSTPASNTALVAGDFAQTGGASPTAFATAISYAGWSTAGYNGFALNANGIAAINTTGVSKFSARNANRDVAASEPTWASLESASMTAYFSESGAGFKPKLLVTYTQTSPSTYWPDANPETASVDGFVARGGVDESLATLRAGAGTSATDTTFQDGGPRLVDSNTADQFSGLDRGLTFFDTSGLGAGATISAAVLSLYGSSKFNGGGTAPDLHIAQGGATSNTALAASDYAQANFGTTSFGSVTYASFSTVAYNDITLNANGIAAISKTGVTKYSHQLSWDIDNSFTGTWAAQRQWQIYPFYSEKGASYAPKLVVTYTVVTWQPRPSGIQPSGGAFMMF